MGYLPVVDPCRASIAYNATRQRNRDRHRLRGRG